MKKLLLTLVLTGLLILGFESLNTAPDHWAPPAIVTIYDVTGNPGWGVALRVAAGEWNAGVEGVEFRFARVLGPLRDPCEMLTGPHTVLVCIHEVKVGYLGVAHQYRSEGHLQEVRIWLTPTPRLRVACHELGHALGLGHRKEGATCMTSRPNTAYPDERDFLRVTEIHRHLH